MLRESKSSFLILAKFSLPSSLANAYPYRYSFPMPSALFKLYQKEDSYRDHQLWQTTTTYLKTRRQYFRMPLATNVQLQFCEILFSLRSVFVESQELTIIICLSVVKFYDNYSDVVRRPQSFCKLSQAICTFFGT